MSGVLVVGEPTDWRATGITGELLAAAGRAAPGEPPELALLGTDLSAVEESGAMIGASRIYLLEHPTLEAGGTGGFEAPVQALEALCRAISPAVVLLPKTDFGANAGPRLAFRLGVPVAQDCIDISRDPTSGRLLVTRPVHGGNAMAVMGFGDRNPQVVIVRAKAFEAAEKAGASAMVERFNVSEVVTQPRARLIETVAEQPSGVRLEDAEIVVGGGRGLGGPEPFEELRELASLLGGAVGASRAACDAGWIDHSFQIGLTGQSISPRLYLTVGISGASQHMAGCSGAKTIVAINRDADANIFKESKYGVVGDWQKVLRAFIATVRDLAVA